MLQLRLVPRFWCGTLVISFLKEKRVLLKKSRSAWATRGTSGRLEAGQRGGVVSVAMLSNFRLERTKPL